MKINFNRLMMSSIRLDNLFVYYEHVLNNFIGAELKVPIYPRATECNKYAIYLPMSRMEGHVFHRYV